MEKKGQENMKIIDVAVEKLIPYARNSRTHDDEQVAQIAASIREFGFTNPILIDAENGIIAGHGRLLAARKLGMTKVPTIQLDHLTATQKKALIIADNKLALNAGWDNEMLALEFEELEIENFNIDLIGFNEEDIKSLKNNVNFNPATEDDQGKLDQLEPKWIDCPHCGKEFDVRQA
jgi:ParB-like chromosome segregation protein Spo0J